MTPFDFPSLLWNRYIEYLWDYQPGSWVDASASTFRLAAAFIIVPLVLLVMLASLSLLHVNHKMLIIPLPSVPSRYTRVGYTDCPLSLSPVRHTGRDIVHHRADAWNH